MKRTLAALTFLLAASAGATAARKESITQLGRAERASYAKAAERHLRSGLPTEVASGVKIDHDDVLSYIRLDNWHILRVETHATDQPYLFYASRPDLTAGYVSLWAGAARKDEAILIEQWVLANVPGSSHALAACFSKLVTGGAST